NKLAELTVVRNGMRPRPDERHVAFQDVEQLRQLVDAGLAEPAPERSYACVVRCRLPDIRTVLEDRHRPELINLECLAVESDPGLPEQNRPARLELDHEGHDGQDWAGQHKAD